MSAGATTNSGARSRTAQGGKPRLLVVSPDFPPDRGGIQALMGGLVTSLHGFEIVVVALDSPGAREHDAGLGFRVRRVAASAALRGARNVPLNAVALHEARSFAPAVCLAGHIVTSPATALLARLRGTPTVQYFHANEIGDKPRLAAFAARAAAASIVVSSYTAGLLAGVEPAAGDVRLIPPGISLPADTHERDTRAGAAISAGVAAETDAAAAAGDAGTAAGAGTAAAAETDAARPPTLVTVSRLAVPYKGHDLLLQAMPAVRARVPDAVWVVVGDGPLRAGLEAEARAAGLGEAVRFVGSVSDQERDRWLARADVFAMPSRLPGGRLAGEGFGIVYMESAARGLPALAGNVGGAVDAIVDGETGLLVDPTDVTAIADALIRLLSDHELAGRLGAAAAARARQFAWPVIAGRVEALLMELVERRPV